MEEIPTGLAVGAAVRQAAREGVSIFVLRRGDPDSGSLVLKINLLNGMVRLFARVRYGENLAFAPLGAEGAMPESESDKIINQQADFDPDVWVVEIEDKEGRLWFEGRVLSSFDMDF